MKGIILAGGSGSRLYPLTATLSKQMLPVYDKPMIYYPLSTLMLAGIRDILLISSPTALPHFRELLGDGSQFGINLSYAAQPRPEGLAQALVIARDFLAGEPATLVLGDNIFFGQGLAGMLQQAVAQPAGATVFVYAVANPESYGVLEFDDRGQPARLVEKPSKPRSEWAVTGIYVYGPDAPDRAAQLRPSDRGELEITDLNAGYLNDGRFHAVRLGRGFAWFDAGTHDDLLAAGEFVRTVETRQNLKICCPEEIAWRQGFIDRTRLLSHADTHAKTAYGAYLHRVARGRVEG
jgi:glucose-1-phosphate thymidylyltransferase